MSDGREVYARARRQAQARTGDPQSTGSQSPAQVRAAADTLNALCGTDGCGHANCLHAVNRAGRVTSCTIMTGAGPCRCQLFTPGGQPCGQPG